MSTTTTEIQGQLPADIDAEIAIAEGLVAKERSGSAILLEVLKRVKAGELTPGAGRREIQRRQLAAAEARRQREGLPPLLSA